MAYENESNERSSRPVRPSRHRRRLTRYRGALRCEWCSRMCEVAPGTRWSTLPLAEWEQVVRNTSVYYCHRRACVTSRAEFNLPPTNVDVLAGD